MNFENSDISTVYLCAYMYWNNSSKNVYCFYIDAILNWVLALWNEQKEKRNDNSK